jgi:hypothetical protein
MIRTRQPQRVVPITGTTGKVYYAYPFGVANVVSNGTTFLTPGPGGIGYATNGGTGDYFSVGAVPHLMPGAALLCQFSTTGTTNSVLSGVLENASPYIVDFNVNCGADTTLAGSVMLQVREDNSANLRTSYTGNIGLNDGRVHTVAFWYEKSTAHRCFVDGIECSLTVSSAGTVTMVGSNPEYSPWIGTRNVRGVGQNGSNSQQKIYLWAQLPTGQSAARLTGLSANPWQLFAAPRRVWDVLPTFPSDLARAKGTMRPTVRV